MEINWTTIVPLVIGAILGFCGTFLVESRKRFWARKDQKENNKVILKGLEKEIEEGIKRCGGLIGFLENKKISFSRIYIEFWDSVKNEFPQNFKDIEILNLLYKIYYRFDLVNFNMEHDRFGPGAAFARQYIDEIKENFSKFKNRVAKI